MTDMKLRSSGVIHGDQCQCPRCQIEKPKEPEIKYTSYQTKAFTIKLLDIEYRDGSWFANYTTISNYKPTRGSAGYGTFLVEMWNKYSTRWNEGKGK